jgi:hypothetical protein
MKARNVALDQLAIKSFTVNRVLTVDELSQILMCSLITVRRRLKEWRVYTSYNKNGRYYTLPSIPTFNAYGIWRYRDIYFSRYGTLKNTVIGLAAKSEKGLTHSELEQIIGMNPKYFMTRFKEVPGLRKETDKHRIIYYSADPALYEEQKRKRFPPEPTAARLPPDATSILILVELIHNPSLSIEELSEQLKQKGHGVEAPAIAALFERYQIDKKKLNTEL